MEERILAKLLDDEEEGLARESRMTESGEYEPVDLSFVADMASHAEQLKTEVDSEKNPAPPADAPRKLRSDAPV